MLTFNWLTNCSSHQQRAVKRRNQGNSAGSDYRYTMIPFFYRPRPERYGRSVIIAFVRVFRRTTPSYTEDAIRTPRQQDPEAFFEHSACLILMKRRSTASAMPFGVKTNLVSTTSLSTNGAPFPAKYRHIHFVSILRGFRRLPKCRRCLDNETRPREIATPRAEI